MIHPRPSRDFVLAVLLLLGLGAITIWFLTSFEKITTQVYIGYQGEARENHLLAAERFLQRSGTPAESIGNLGDLMPLPPVTDTLIAPTGRLTLDRRHSTELLDWVQQGGHLIVTARHPDTTDPLLDDLDAHLAENETGDIDENERIPAYADLAEADDFLQVDFDPAYRLEAGNLAPSWTIEDEYGVHLMQVRQGNGTLTVLSDAGFMNNSRIPRYDHALFLWHLANLDGRSGKIWLVYSDDMPPLWRWLLENAWPVVSSALVLLLAWLLRFTRRFGPVLPGKRPVRRRFLEHIRASGQFLWRHGRSGDLLGSVREAVFERIARRKPGWLELPAEALHRQLAEHTGLSAEHVRQALELPGTTDELEFTGTINRLETIRKML